MGKEMYKQRDHQFLFNFQDKNLLVRIYSRPYSITGSRYIEPGKFKQQKLANQNTWKYKGMNQIECTTSRVHICTSFFSCTDKQRLNKAQLGDIQAVVHIYRVIREFYSLTQATWSLNISNTCTTCLTLPPEHCLTHHQDNAFLSPLICVVKVS